jgi:hypothetical protein
VAKHRSEQQGKDASHREAMRIARGTQRPGQTKQQTRLITQGIQKGIEQYKKQQSANKRELDRKLKKAAQQAGAQQHGVAASEVRERVTYRQHWLPWALFIASLLALVACWLLR